MAKYSALIALIATLALFGGVVGAMPPPPSVDEYADAGDSIDTHRLIDAEIVANTRGSDDNTVLKGYDVVAYFTQNSAVQGSAQYALEWGGYRWLFSSDEHRELFKANPLDYQPQYGGYCAYAASRNYIYPVNPAAFEVTNGKLYLNASFGVQRQWQSARNTNIVQGDNNWPGLRARLTN